MPETEADLFEEEEEKEPNSTGGFFTKRRLRENGGSETSQSPFSIDEDDDPTDWFTSKGAHIPIENSESENQAFEKTVEQRREKEKAQKENEHALKYSYEAQFETMLELEITEDEFMSVVSGVNKIYEANKHKKDITYYTMSYIYKVKNHGFNNYLFSDKMENKGNRKDWN